MVAVLSSDSGHYRQAYEGFQEEWGSSVPFVLLGHEPPGAPGVIVAFGSKAALKDWPASVLLATCLAPGARPTRAGDLMRVDMLADPGALVARLKGLLPGLKTLRVLWSSDFADNDVSELAASGESAGVTVISERVLDPRRLPESVRAFTGRVDAILLMPDPALVNAENFAAVREYAAAVRVPFLAPTEGLAEKGATATLSSPFREVGRATAVALKAKLRGERLNDPYHPRTIVVTVSESAAAATGLNLKSATGVDRTVP